MMGMVLIKRVKMRNYSRSSMFLGNTGKYIEPRLCMLLESHSVSSPCLLSHGKEPAALQL